jgi:hypothetical protein
VTVLAIIAGFLLQVCLMRRPPTQLLMPQKSGKIFVLQFQATVMKDGSTFLDSPQQANLRGSAICEWYAEIQCSKTY